MTMKQTNFSQQFPYLDYYIENWGEMETTNGDWGHSRLTLLDEGGTVYEDKGSTSNDEALEKAEKFLRSDYGPQCFDKESIVALEEEYKENGLV